MQGTKSAVPGTFVSSGGGPEQGGRMKGWTVARARPGVAWKPGRMLVIAAALATALTVATAVQSRADAPHSWADGLPGCDASRPAIAHNADQRVLVDQPQNGPVPCGMLTGWPTVENKIEVTNQGAVIYEPAVGGAPILSGDGRGATSLNNQSRFARTFDNGGKWTAHSVQVSPETYNGDSQQDNNVYVDHDTGRFFWYVYETGYFAPPVCSNGANATVVFSDDSGSTWSWGFDQDHDCSENPTLLTGKPTVAGVQRTYPNVVYLCGDNTSSGVGQTGNPGFSCSKSVTGGAQWLGTTFGGQGFYSGPMKDLLSPYAQCAGGQSKGSAAVQPLPTGTLAVVVSCNNGFFLSESGDEGATWDIAQTLPHGGTLRVDSAGNLYLVELVNGASLMLSHSTDGGATWSDELDMTAPGVTSVGAWTFAQGTHAAGHVGDVAVTYYAKRGTNTTSDGFITATRDALASDPVFWSGQVNDPNRPLLYNTQTNGNPGITVLDFNGGAWAPDTQSVWGSWVQECGANVVTDCQSRLPTTAPTAATDGFAGRLVWPDNQSG